MRLVVVLLASYQRSCKDVETESEASGTIINPRNPQSEISSHQYITDINGETVDWLGVQRHRWPDLSGDTEILRRHVPLSPCLLHRRIPSATGPPRAPNPPRSLEPVTRAPGAGRRVDDSPLLSLPPRRESRAKMEGDRARRLRLGDGVGSPGPGEASERLAAGM